MKTNTQKTPLVRGLTAVAAASISLQSLHAVAATTYLTVSPRQAVKDTVPFAAQPLPLTDVRLTGGPLKHAQDLDLEYLLKLEPDRMLYYFYKDAKLKPKADEGYGGWDGGGRNLTGHIAGHYLSAVSIAYAATDDPRFKERADYIVDAFKTVQDTYPDDYTWGWKICASVSPEFSKGNIRSGGFDLNGLWSPWYTEHKIFAGLRDAYRYTGNRKALDVETKFAGWAASIVDPLSDAQDQKMLNTEFGGMNEVLADLYADTGDKKWLTLSDKFEHKSVVEPLARHDDILGGLHENCQIPKMIGDLKRYIYDGDQTDGSAARFFWDQVVFHHSFATGGQGHDEYFGPPDKLNDIINGRDAESCCAYNMLKLTRTLFALQPDIKFADYQERTVYNHVLASIDPNDGRTCYMVPVGQGVQHEYQDMFHDFTCCVGTGMEDHALLGDGIYYESGDKLCVKLYAPTVAQWKVESPSIEMKTDFPIGESVTLQVSVKSRKRFTLALRRPAWAGDGFTVAVNGKAVSDLPAPDSYVEVKRSWKNGDTVTLTLPKQLNEEPLPENPRRVALLWGPLVLAGDLGPGERRRGSGNRSSDENPAPVFVAAEQPLVNWLKPVADKPGTFHTADVGKPEEETFVPFYELPERTYGIYWDVYTPLEWDKKSAELATERERQHKLQLATVAFVQPGLMQAERDFNEQGENSRPDRVMGRAARRGRAWFSFDLPVDAAHPMTLVVTYYSDEWRKRTFDIQVNGQTVGQQVVEKWRDAAFL